MYHLIADLAKQIRDPFGQHILPCKRINDYKSCLHGLEEVFLTSFQSFINGPVMFKTIDRPSFSAVQQKIFPGYFAMQTAIPIVLALTFPGNHLSGIPSGIYGVLDQSNRCSSLLPIAAMFATGLANLAVLLPATLKVMKARQAQGINPL